MIHHLEAEGYVHAKTNERRKLNDAKLKANTKPEAKLEFAIRGLQSTVCQRANRGLARVSKSKQIPHQPYSHFSPGKKKNFACGDGARSLSRKV